MKRLLSYIASAVLGLWLAVRFVPGVHLQGYANSNFFGIPLSQEWQIYLLIGGCLGLLNFFVKPMLDIITLPLRIITLGIFGFIINLGLVFLTNYAFREFSAPWIWPLLWTTFIITTLRIIISGIVLKEGD